MKIVRAKHEEMIKAACIPLFVTPIEMFPDVNNRPVGVIKPPKLGDEK